MTFNFLGPGLTVNVEAKVKEQIILDSSDLKLLSRLTENFKRVKFQFFAHETERRRKPK